MTKRRHRLAAKGLLLAGGATYLGYRALRGPGDDITGSVVLITGGSRGLGLLLAREFALHGCRIVICARDSDELDRAAADLRARGATVLPIVCDVADHDQVEAMVDHATRRFGGVDILVNNAGIIQVGPFESMSLDDFKRAMDIMFWGALHTTLAVLPRMRARGHGRIVNITSIGGKVSVPHLLPYGAAKFALVGLSQGLRAELRKSGIFVTTVVPGLMRTGSPVNALFKGDHAKEFAWFSLGSATPLSTISGTRAARLIVEATRRRDAEVTLSWQAKMLRLAHGIAPGGVTELLGLIDRLLPDGTDRAERRGREIEMHPALARATTMVRRAAARNNE